jgi:hypothetical protein
MRAGSGTRRAGFVTDSQYITKWLTEHNPDPAKLLRAKELFLHSNAGTLKSHFPGKHRPITEIGS